MAKEGRREEAVRRPSEKTPVVDLLCPPPTKDDSNKSRATRDTARTTPRGRERERERVTSKRNGFGRLSSVALDVKFCNANLSRHLEAWKRRFSYEMPEPETGPVYSDPGQS